MILHTVGKTRKNADLNYRNIFPRPRCHFFSESRWFLSIEATERERERDSNKPRRKREGRGEEKLVLSLVYSETSKENARVTKAKILVWLSCTAEKDLPPGDLFIPRPSPFYLGSEKSLLDFLCWGIETSDTAKKHHPKSELPTIFFGTCDDSLPPSAEGGKRRNTVMTRETRPMEKMGDFLIGLYF